ncbi:germinal-center associated nuclear protein-like isoform X2 [Liolophura sinensis]|uniref:germinal-center associated nuclear protein-like isoform X2 n=1 Tax=Liolophura sinensis TaxID=3198878 RepID=UPI0031586968
MSGPFGRQTRENVFSQPSATFGQGFGHVFGVQQSSGMASDGNVKEANSSNLFASSPSSKGTGLFGTSSSDGKLFSQGSNQMDSSTGAGQNLFKQFTSSAPESQAFSGGSVFGGAKLFSSSTSTAGESRSVSAIFETSSGTSSKTTSSKSLQSVFDKEPKPKGLFGNPPPANVSPVFGTSSVSSSKPRQLFGKEVGEHSGSLLKSEKAKGGREQKAQQSSVDSTAVSDEYLKDPHDFQGEEKTKILFGKSQKDASEKTSPRRRQLIRRDRGGAGAARSMFSKALSGVTGKTDRKVEKKELDSTKNQAVAGTGQTRKSVGGGNVQMKRLMCRDVPSTVTKYEIQKHFSKYGSVERVFLNPAKMSAIVYFTNHEDAENAYKNGHMIRPNQRLHIFWKSQGSSTGTAASSKIGTTFSSKSTSSSRLPSGRTLHSEVEDELASMAGADAGGTMYRTPVRPSEVVQQELSPERHPPVRQSHSPSRSISPSPIFTASENVPKTTVTKASLESLTIPAKNTLDMYLVLDNRDKILKQGRRKQSDLKTAKAVQGTCPDMCYEKERYDRDAKRRLSIFEMIPGTENIQGQNPRVDHRHAVKEYSRSSADQEEPLPHEMRPGPVLDMTMTYLLTEIADKADDIMWLEWYDFLWNRTRGIRKDITQQMLCDRTAVGLIEKCARFHIYCAERLCEEDFHTFDQKINTENLTKSLQSLKELYSDLAIKQQVFCETEAEFRAYMVLLNLNEGDTLREVQQLRGEVRASAEINFALQVYSALNSNNYVRFFKLAKKASFLNACIMHRYFVQVRSQALKTMLRAFAFGGRPIQFPLIELMRVLAFEDTEEAAEFCMHYGLLTKAGEVCLDRNSYIEPELGISLRRAHSVIESKLTVSVGEVINGGPLPPLTLPEPQISFDVNGRYIGEMPTVEAPPIEVPEEIVSKPPKSVVPNEIVKEIARQLFLEIIEEFCLEVSSQFHSAIHSYLDTTSEEIWTSVYEEISTPIIKSCCDAELRTRKEEKEREMAIAARIAQRKLHAREEMELMIDEVISDEVLKISTSEVRAIEMQLKQEQIARCSENVHDEVLQEVVSDVIQETTEEVYRVDVEERLQELEDLEDCVRLYRVAKFWHIWKRMYATRMRLRSMLTFPGAPSTEHVTDQVDVLIPGREYDRVHNAAVYINDAAKLHVLGPLVAEEKQKRLHRRITLHHILQRLRYHVAYSPLNLGPIVGKPLVQAWQAQTGRKCNVNDKVFWKLVISLPNDNECDDHSSVFSDWLISKFNKGPVPELDTYSKIETVALYTTPLRFSHQPVSNLATCVKIVHGMLKREEIEQLNVSSDKALLGTSALLFVLYLPEILTEEFWAKSLHRLLAILDSKPKRPSLPLVIILVGESDSLSTQTVEQNLGITRFQEDLLLSSVYTTRMQSSSISGVDVLSSASNSRVAECIRWLSEHYTVPVDLKSSRLLSLLEETLASEFYQPVLQNLKQRKLEGHLHQSPAVLIELYNAVITHLQDTVTSADLTEYSWPVSEFSYSNSDLPSSHWNSEHHLEYLFDIFAALTLPDITFTNIQDATWTKGCEDVWEYVSTVIQNESGCSKKTQFMSQVRRHLEKCEKEFEDTCFLVEGDHACEPTYVNIPWTDIIMAAVDFRLACVYNDSMGDEKSLEMVHYLPREFQPPESWYIAKSERNTSESTFLKSTIRYASEKRRFKNSEASEDHASVKRSRLENRTDTEQTLMHGAKLASAADDALDVDTVVHPLKQQLAAEKKQSMKCADLLKKALESECVDLGHESMEINSSNLSVPLCPNYSNKELASSSLSALSSHDLELSLRKPKTSVKSSEGDISMDYLRDSSETVQDRCFSLIRALSSEKRAYKLFEMKLQNMMDR